MTYILGTVPNYAGRGRMKQLLAVLAVVAAAGILYVYFNPEVADSLVDTARPLIEDTPLESEPKKTELYKWRDEHGGWMVSDKPPPEGTDYELLQYTDDQNILPLPPQLKDQD